MKTRIVKRIYISGHVDYIIQYRSWFIWTTAQTFSKDVKGMMIDAICSTIEIARASEKTFVNSRKKPVLEIID